MRIVFLGASGMVGAGALREALAAPDVSASTRGCLFAIAPRAALAVRAFGLASAMLRVVQGRADRYILESADTNRIGA